MSGKEETLGSLVLFNDVTNQLNRDTCYSTLHVHLQHCPRVSPPPPSPQGKKVETPYQDMSTDEAGMITCALMSYHYSFLLCILLLLYFEPYKP